MTTAPDTVTFEHGGLVLTADAYGDRGAPVVLLQHGGGQTRFAWGGTAQALAERGFRTVSIDLRGHGDSGWSADGDYAFQRFAEDTRAVAGSLGQPAIVGASLGGIAGLLAQHMAELRPFWALVLVDITPRMRPGGADGILAFMGSRLEEGFADLEEAADAIAEYLPHRPRPKNLDGLQKNLRRREDGRWRWHWDPQFVTGPRPPGGRFSEVDLDAAARALEIPSLLVRGRLSELVSEEDAEHFLSLVPSAEYVDVSGAGHMVAGDRNDVFSDAVCGFLERHRPAGTEGSGR